MFKKKNFAKSLTTNNPLAIGGLSLTVTTGEGAKFPATGVTNLFRGVIWDASLSNPEADADREIVEAYRSADDTFTIIRAQESTMAKEWPAGSNFMLTATAGVFDEYDASLASEVTTPADADLLGVWVSGILKKLTWANLKATLLAYFLTEPQITQYGMARQAIMNGNFDVWQRGTSVAPADNAFTYQADRFADFINKNGGTLPTLTRSRQLLTSGDIANAFYHTRLATNGAGTSLGVSSVGQLVQKIENGTRNLCGLDKKVTVSFYAKSDIANKRICPTLYQHYGSGGSPSTGEFIKGTPITLTSTWTKYTATFTTNTLVGKTFGTAGDDFLQVSLWYMWGTTIGNTQVQASVTAETFVGAGNIDIAQVQLCSGDVALPFQPNSFEEEYRICRRYFQKSYEYSATPGTSTTVGVWMTAVFATTAANNSRWFLTKHPRLEKGMRTAPNIILYSATGVANKWIIGNLGEVTCGYDPQALPGEFWVQNATGSPQTTILGEAYGQWTADSEL